MIITKLDSFFPVSKQRLRRCYWLLSCIELKISGRSDSRSGGEINA